jgi:hypothetical protein
MFNRLFLTGLLWVAATRSNDSLAVTNTIRTDGLQQRLKQLTQNGGVILLDGDNIRGKTKFRLSKEDLCRDVEEWMSEWGLFGLVTLMYDHASQHTGYFLPKSGFKDLNHFHNGIDLDSISEYNIDLVDKVSLMKCSVYIC